MPLPALPTIPSLPTPSLLKKNVGILLYYKDKTGFITGATVTFEKILLSPTYAINFGVLYYASIPTGMGIEIYAQKADIDFGKGKGVKALVGSDTGFDSEIHEFVAKTPFPCPSITPIIAASNFSSTIPSAIPNVTVLPMTGFIPGIGNANITEGTYEIRLDDTIILNSNIPSNGKIDTNLPKIKDIPFLVGKTSAILKVIITWYHCKFEATQIVSLPAITPKLPICTPPQVYNPTTGKCETPPPICTPPQVYNPITGKCEVTIKLPICTPPQIYNPTTGKCESPTPTTCPDLQTTVSNIVIPNTLPSLPSIPFFISLGNIKLECPSNPALTKKMTGETGTITLGSLSSPFPIPSPEQSPGEVYFDLSKLVDMSQIIGGTPVITPPPTTISSPILPTKPQGDFGANIPAAISYLSTYHPGKWLFVEPTTFGGGKYVKVTRANNSYTYARTYKELDEAMSY